MHDPVVGGVSAAETFELRLDPHRSPLDLTVRWAGIWPMPMLASAAGLVHCQPFVNLVVTNERGPEHPLELLGAEPAEIVSLGGKVALGVAVFSYRGRLVIGLHADAEAIVALDVLASGIQHAVGRLSLEEPARPGSRLSVVQ